MANEFMRFLVTSQELNDIARYFTVTATAFLSPCAAIT